MVWLRKMRKQGYKIHVFFLWVKAVDLALSRVQERVSRGGHDVPEPVIRRRFDRSIRNFLILYRQLADSWTLFDNSGAIPSVVALERDETIRIINKGFYKALIQRYDRT
jgi:predicted ABC-type ATPase